MNLQSSETFSTPSSKPFEWPFFSSRANPFPGSDIDAPDLESFHDPSRITVSLGNRFEFDQIMNDTFRGQGACWRLLQNRTVEDYRGGMTNSILVNVSFGCYESFKMGTSGTGNRIYVIYALRMAAQALEKTDLIIQCHDAIEHKSDLILPWLTGVFPRPSRSGANHEIDEDKATPNVMDVCKSISNGCPLGYQLDNMIFDFRRLAIAMVGIPSKSHPSAQWAKDNLWSIYAGGRANARGQNWYQVPHPQPNDVPVFPGTELDDVVLHVRCGDIMIRPHPNYGFMKFGSYSRHISPSARTIGIVTQPFEAASQQQRRFDGYQSAREKCKTIILALVDYLQSHFPRAKVSVRNTPNETITLAFARMIMAKQTIVTVSTFSLFPALVSFGEGYIQVRRKVRLSKNWLVSPPYVGNRGNIKFIDPPFMISGKAKRLWGLNGSDVLDWLRSDY